MKFINKGGPIKIRIGEPSGCYWKTIKKNEVIDLDIDSKCGRSLKLTELKTTEGKLGDQKVETKQIESPKIIDFYDELIKIKGIGKKTAQDIIKVFPTKQSLIDAVSDGEHLPFRNDVTDLLKEKFLKKEESYN